VVIVCIVLTEVYRLRRLSHMVLDEADSLLDDSFNVLLKGILKRMKIVRNILYLRNIL
jgi:superfamily II DNA/RNA helicase